MADMSLLSLADAPFGWDQYDGPFLDEKLWYSFIDNSEALAAWEEANQDNDNVGKYSGWVFVARISNEFLSIWPEPNLDDNLYEYVTRWSGGCFRDLSSNMGGFCILEDNDTNFDNNRPAYYTYVENPDSVDVANPPTPTAYVQGDTNRHINFYRLTDS